MGTSISIDLVDTHDRALVDRLVEPEALMDTARALAADTLAAEPSVAAAIKALCVGVRARG